MKEVYLALTLGQKALYHFDRWDVRTGKLYATLAAHFARLVREREESNVRS